MQLADDVSTELDRRTEALRDDRLRQPPDLRPSPQHSVRKAERGSGPRRADAAQEVGGRQDGSGAASVEALRALRELRRIWMSAPLRRTPHALLVLTLVEGESEAARVAQDEAACALNGLSDTLAEFGPVFLLDCVTLAMVIPGQGVRGATRIAKAIEMAIAKRNASVDAAPLIACAGIAELVAEDDPVSTLLIAKQSLASALGGDGAR